MIAIAGGGIGGLTLAVALQQQGNEVLVLERQARIRDTGAGISLWPNALAALDSLGLGTLIRATGRSASSGGTRKVDGRKGLTFSGRGFEAALGDALVCVHRGELVVALAAMLPPGTVRTAQDVTSYELDGGAVRIHTSDGGVVEADGLVGADGIGSSVARTLCGDMPCRYSGYTAWRGIAHGVADFGGEGISACLSGGHELGWLPLPGDRYYWFATSWVPEGHRFPEGDTEYLAREFAGWPEPVPSLIEATEPDELVRSDIVDRPVADRFCEGAVALIGDAAHPMRPHLGQGGCQAIEDAAALAACLRTSPDPADAFARYARLRRRRARTVVALSRRSGFTRPPGAATRLADRLSSMAPALSIDPVLRVLAPIAGYQAGLRAVGADEHRRDT